MQKRPVEPQADETRSETERVDVQTRLTAEQFAQWLVKRWPQVDKRLIPAFTDVAFEYAAKSEAGVREEIERLKNDKEYEEWRDGYGDSTVRPKDAFDAGWSLAHGRIGEEHQRVLRLFHKVIAAFGFTTTQDFSDKTDELADLAIAKLTELRAKLAEQEKERDLYALLRGICEEVIDWLATLSYDGIWETKNVLDHPLTKDIRLKLQQMYDHPLDNKLLIRTDVVQAKLERAEAAEAELAALRERERSMRTCLETIRELGRVTMATETGREIILDSIGEALSAAPEP